MFQRGYSDIFMFILDIVASVFGVTCSVITMVSFLPTVGLSFRGWRNLEGESGLSWSRVYLPSFSVKPILLLPMRMRGIWRTTADYIIASKLIFFCNKLKMQMYLIQTQMRPQMDAFWSITLQGKWWWLSPSFQD